MTNPILSFPSYAEEFLKIITKDGKLINFELNHYQRKLIELIEQQRAQKRPVRILVLKARQVGMSTLSAAYTYFQTATNFFQKSVLVAHDLDSSGNLFSMVKRFYDLSPEAIKPLKRYSNKKELVFENPDEATRKDESGLMSAIDIETAGSATAGRSSTIHHLHISELAFWPNARETLSGLMQALSTDKSSTCIIESTAQGFDGTGKEFYLRCEAAINGDSDFAFFFIPWTDVSEYQIKWAQIKDHTPRELLLKKSFGLTDAQLAWRRWKIRNDFSGDELLFQQEYPITPEEAFIHSGRPVFDVEALTLEIDKAKSNDKKHDGIVTVFEEPKPNEVYVVGSDLAEGLIDGDFSTAFVLSRDFRQVACIHVHMAPDLFAKELIKLAKRYNNALLAWEINNHGAVVTSIVKQDGYTNTYQREVFDKHAVDVKDKIGWQTNVRTKALMLDEFIAAHRDKALDVRDVELLREMRTVVYEEDGSVNLNGKDRVVSACIALQAIKQAPIAVKYKAELMDDEDKPPRFESFQERQRRLSRGKGESYFGS